MTVVPPHVSRTTCASLLHKIQIIWEDFAERDTLLLQFVEVQGVVWDHTPRVFFRNSLIPCLLQPDYGRCLSSQVLRNFLLGFYLRRIYWDQNMCSQKEGLAQKYASSHLPLSAFQCRQGIILEFCKHLICGGAKEAQYGHLRLVTVLPIANLYSYCEALWKKILDVPEEFSKFVGCTTPEKALSCGGRTHAQSLRSVLRTGEIGVIVLGKLKVSLSSGRLQLVDATGEVDIVTDLPATWDSDRIFEANDFRLIMEGMPPKLADLDSTIYSRLSCRSIFI
ncbi:hypothetical protein OROGR_029866 [Orobanche gracilis]